MVGLKHITNDKPCTRFLLSRFTSCRLNFPFHKVSIGCPKGVSMFPSYSIPPARITFKRPNSSSCKLYLRTCMIFYYTKQIYGSLHVVNVI